MFDGVLDDRLQDERRHEQIAKQVGHVALDAEPLLESSLLDGEVRIHELQLFTQRYEIAGAPENCAQQRRELVQGVHGARRRRRDEVSHRR